MKRLFIIILGIIILSGCGQSEYDKNMSNGKEFLKSQEYDKAIESFNFALIDKPSDSDASILLSKARDQKIESLMKDMVVQYKNGFKVLMIRYINAISQTKEDELTVKFQQDRDLELIEIEKDARFFITEYQDYKKIVAVHENLLQSISFASKAQHNVVTLMQYLDDNELYRVTDEDVEKAQEELEENKNQRQLFLGKFQEDYSKLLTDYGVDIDN